MSVFLTETSKTRSSLNSLRSGPRKFAKSDFFGIGPDVVSPEKNSFFKFWRVTIRGAQPSARLSEEIRLPEGSQAPLLGVSSRVLRGVSAEL